ncbi:MAG: Fe2+-dependent dioxygenase [Thiovulaceae bacterium]|nr:Fe2+-dependent dioxygenase [Sulfurimonadaceae bacterium]
MIKIVKNVLDGKTLKHMHAELSTAKFDNGKLTASGMAKKVKHNYQLDSKAHPDLIKIVSDTLLKNPSFLLYTMPYKITSPIISRYTVGQTYGYHSDGAEINGVRTDISYTLFLEDPKCYEGGELALETGYGEMLFKLSAGDMVIYPTSALHRVAPLSKGVRTVAVGWVQSKIRDIKSREIIVDLELTRREYLLKNEPDKITDILLKTSANLQRMWISH